MRMVPAFPRLLFLASLVLAGLLAALPRPASAQSTAVSIELVLDESYFLPGEELPVGVRISNLSGRPLTFGTTTNWLTFLIESRKGDVVTRLGSVPVLGEFTLDSAKAGTKWWNLQPYFEIDQPGPYHVYAELRIPDSNLRIISEPALITLQGSSRLWEITFGVPPAPDASTNPPPTPELRRYALQAATRLKERKLYARVSDEADNRIYKVVLLDRFLSFSNPQQQLDARSRLHVLFQTGGSTYTYCVVNPDGDLVARQRHEIVPGSRPRLAKTPDGSIGVAGGQRTPSYSDIPPWEPPVVSLVDTNTPAPVTNAPAADPKKKSRDTKRKSSSDKTK